MAVWCHLLRLSLTMCWFAIWSTTTVWANTLEPKVTSVESEPTSELQAEISLAATNQNVLIQDKEDRQISAQPINPDPVALEATSAKVDLTNPLPTPTLWEDTDLRVISEDDALTEELNNISTSNNLAEESFPADNTVPFSENVEGSTPHETVSTPPASSSFTLTSENDLVQDREAEQISTGPVNDENQLDESQPNERTLAESNITEPVPAPTLWGEPDPGEPDEETSPRIDLLPSSSSIAPVTQEFTLFPIGLNVGSRNVLPSTLVKGMETTGQVVAFDQWLIPFDDVTQALAITVTQLDDKTWELRSPGLVTRIDPATLQTDVDLGLVLSIGEIETLLGVPAQFEQLNYTVRFDPPWAGQGRRNRQTSEQPIVTEGLSVIEPSQFSLTGIAQQATISGQSEGGTGNQIESHGSLSTLGTAFGGSWYLKADQTSLSEIDSWRLRELQYLHQTPAADAVLGSQPTFWRSRRRGNDYWGATYVQRWGFDPPETTSGSGGFSPRQRLQAAAVGRTVTGEAEPGTLVQLTQGLRNEVIDEVLVDSSGLYRFDNVPTGSRSGSNYQVLLYPNGQLTASPEIRSANFSTLPGQLPIGASALIVSGGFNRDSGNSFLGRLDGFRGGVAYRQGVSEDLTLGVGLVQDVTTQALADLFYAPSNFPLEVALSALTDLKTSDVDVTADVQLRPSREVYVSFNSDQFAQRFNAEWRVAKGLTLLAKGNTRDEAIAGGVRFSFRDRNLFASGSATLDTQSRLRWSLSSRLGHLGLRHSGNELATESELAYNLSDSYAYGDGHGLLLNYETRKINDVNNYLGTLSWRYRSAERVTDGRSIWDVSLGYGIGSQGNGIVAAVTTAILPGLDIRARYQGISAVSDRDTFRIEFLPRFNLQGGIGTANRYQDNLRTEGGLMLQPFFDENNNGIWDNDEALYTDDLDLLLSINHQPLNRYRPQTQGHGTTVNLFPGDYRLDLDPAGYPLDWKASGSAYAVEVVPGQYTPVKIPLTRSYSLIGVLLDADGNAVSGRRVQALNTEADNQQPFSVTNAAGVFYLEGLEQGRYKFMIGDQPVPNAEIIFMPESEPFQEINFRLSPTGIDTQIVELDL
ncbi:MAG: carboxypeptidase-like regulatory domain-containing protein [Cyanobacteria bacterium P01_B01_bin.77]